MADIVSTDGHCSVRLHTDWASVLVWTDLAGPVTIYRDGAEIVSLDSSARQIWYDHYPPLDVPVFYHVSNAGTTSTTAEIAVPADGGQRCWLKSGADPNLSKLVTVTDLGVVEYGRRRGVFTVVGRSAPFIVEAGMSPRSRPLTVWTTTGAERDAVLDIIAAGSLCVVFHPDVEEANMWASGDSPRVSRGGTFAPNVGWSIETVLTETDPYAPALQGNIIPGWGWDDVAATWATWDAVEVAKATWLDLVKHGVY